MHWRAAAIYRSGPRHSAVPTDADPSSEAAPSRERLPAPSTRASACGAADGSVPRFGDDPEDGTLEPLTRPLADRAALLHALAEDEITLLHQPIVRLRDGRPIGTEALARWYRAPVGMEPWPTGPDLFVPLAEREGLGWALTCVVAARAAREVAALRGGPRPWRLPVSINLPLDAALRPGLASSLGALCRAARLPPARLRLELTETAPVEDLSGLRRALLRLWRAGHRVVVDDMGPEADRDRLLGLPFAGIKLDRHLVAELPRARAARARVERLVARAHAAGMRVTAEGIATARLWRAAAALGVDNGQGHGIGQPMPSGSLPAWSAAWGALPARGTVGAFRG